MSLFELTSELLGILPETSVAIDMGQFCKQGQSTTWSSKSDVLAAMGIWMAISQIAISLAFLQHRCSSSADIVKDYRLKEEVEMSMNFVRQKTIHVTGQVDGIISRLGDQLESEQLLVSGSSIKVWLQAVAAIMPLIARGLVLQVLGLASTVASDVQRFTPKWDHLVTDERVNMTLAKKGLLQCPSRQELNEKSVLLFHCIADTSRLYTHWGLMPEISGDSDFKEDLDLANGIWTAAVKAITMIACVNTFVNLKGEEQATSSAGLIKKKSSIIPAALLAELQKYGPSVKIEKAPAKTAAPALATE